MRASALCADGQDAEGRELDPDELAHTQGVEAVILLDPKMGPIPARASAAPGANGQADLAQRFHQRKACCIHSCRILEWSSGLRLHLGVAELGGGPVPFGFIAFMATEHEVAHPL